MRSTEQEISLLKDLYKLLLDENFEAASELFHSTCVVLEGEDKRVFQTQAQRIRFLQDYNNQLNKNLADDYIFSVKSSKALAPDLRFSQLKLSGTAKHQGIKRKIEVLFTLSSDDQGQPKIMVMVLDEL